MWPASSLASLPHPDTALTKQLDGFVGRFQIICWTAVQALMWGWKGSLKWHREQTKQSSCRLCCVAVVSLMETLSSALSVCSSRSRRRWSLVLSALSLLLIFGPGPSPWLGAAAPLKLRAHSLAFQTNSGPPADFSLPASFPCPLSHPTGVLGDLRGAGHQGHREPPANAHPGCVAFLRLP